MRGETLNASGSRWAATIATLLFFFNGGLGFVDFFRDWRGSGKGLLEFLSHLDTNYAHIASKGIVWANVIADGLLPQRPLLFGLAIALMIFSLFVRAWRNTESGQLVGNDWRTLLAAGVLAGLLPAFHTHSYAAVGIVSGILFLLRPRRVWFAFWIPAVLFALPHFVALGNHVAAAGFMRFAPGWRGHHEANWPLFWFRNIGLPALLIIPAWIAAPRGLRYFYIAFLGLLLVSLLVVASPNDYDNLKLMYCWYAATCVLIGAWLVRIAQRPPWRAVVVALVAVSVFSGVLAVGYEAQTSRLMFNREELTAARFVKERTEPHALFLTAPSLHQPILSLAGRAVVRGPTAWLWSHGYRFAEREADVRAIYAGRDDALELLRYYRVDYVYLGTREVAELKANRDFFDRSLPATYRGEGIAIYDARQLRPPGEAAKRASYPPREYASRVDRDPSQPLVEFRDIACELYRFYDVMFGRVPRYAEFMKDLKQLGRGLYPGSPGWRDVLDANKRMLLDEMRQRSEFKGRSGPKGPSRGCNAAYVLVHYFGYFRRNPDDLPDHDLTGYNFWYREMESTRDYRSLTRAFLESDEYKNRQP